MTEDKKATDWAEYNKNSSAARPRLLETLEKYSQTAGQALDLGCGGGRDTRELLKRNWRVDAVDSDLASLELLQKSLGESKNLKIITSSFETLQLSPNTYDLINASYALPFCKPEMFSSFWQKIVQSLKPNGIISCEFFGKNDAWNKLPRPAQMMSFHSFKEVQDFVAGLHIESLKEEEFEGPTFAGPTKHWHIITCIVRKK